MNKQQRISKNTTTNNFQKTTNNFQKTLDIFSSWDIIIKTCKKETCLMLARIAKYFNAFYIVFVGGFNRITDFFCYHKVMSRV